MSDPTPSYRYLLTRNVAPLLPGTLGWIMLNPSTADEDADDPTIRKVVGFTRRAGFGVAVVANLYPMRATKPRDLWAVDERTRRGAYPDESIAILCHDSHAVVLAWGANASRCPVRAAHVERCVQKWARGRVLDLGRTKDGHPRHPLMTPYSVAEGWTR